MPRSGCKPRCVGGATPICWPGRVAVETLEVLTAECSRLRTRGRCGVFAPGREPAVSFSAMRALCGTPNSICIDGSGMMKPWMILLLAATVAGTAPVAVAGRDEAQWVLQQQLNRAAKQKPNVQASAMDTRKAALEQCRRGRPSPGVSGSRSGWLAADSKPPPAWAVRSACWWAMSSATLQSSWPPTDRVLSTLC